MGISPNDLLLVFGTVALLGACCFFAFAWRTPAAFLGFFLWIHIEDLVRIRLGNQPLVFFVKTLLFSAMLGGFLYHQFARRRGRVWKGFPVVLPLGLFFGFAIVQAFNPEIQHPLQPLIGIHSQFLYIPMFLLAYHYFDREERIQQFLLFIFGLAALESLLTLPQMAWGPAWWFSIVGKPDTLEMFVSRAGIGRGEDFFRPSSIFANAGRFYQFLSVVATMAVGALFYFQGKRQRLCAYLFFICIAIGVFITSGRTAMYLLVATLLVFLVMGFARHKVRLQFTIAVMVAVFVMMWTLPPVLGKTTSYIQNLFVHPVSTFDMTPGSGSAVERLYRYTISLDRAIATAGWTGHGLGSNSLGLYFIGMQTQGEEPGYAALIWEYGLLGLLLWLLWMGSLWRKSFQAYCELRGTPHRPIALAVLLLVSFAFVYQYLGYQIMQNYLVTIHFWTFVAMLFALQRLRAQEHEASLA